MILKEIYCGFDYNVYTIMDETFYIIVTDPDKVDTIRVKKSYIIEFWDFHVECLRVFNLASEKPEWAKNRRIADTFSLYWLDRLDTKIESLLPKLSEEEGLDILFLLNKLN
jgi:hypothetical protein